MKATRKLLIFVISLFFLSCSIDENFEFTGFCYSYYVKISGDCNCDNDQCEERYRISKGEYNRLKRIINKSNEKCNAVNGKTRFGANYSGYLISIDRNPIFCFDEGI